MVDFYLEVDTEGLPDIWADMLKTIGADKDSSTREKQLVLLILQLGRAFQKLVMDLETGSLVVKVDDDKIPKRRS
mgnify:CR=1 FL=1